MEEVILAQASPPTGIEDVPDVMAELYLDVVRFADTTPSWLQEVTALFTEGAVLLLLGLLVLAWWRARGDTARSMALTLLAGVGLVVAYLFSEWSKTFVEVDRPCRTLDVASIAECPPVGDWSLPSNHATIAGAVVVGLLIARPKVGLIALPLGALEAFSRVFVGVHYPHDVILGFLMGGFIALVVMLALARPGTLLVGRLREHRTIGMLLATPAARRGDDRSEPPVPPAPRTPQAPRTEPPTEPVRMHGERGSSQSDRAAQQTRRLP